MPFPHSIARINRIGLNRVTRLFAGRLPPFALIRTVGRTSGKEYSTPIMVFRHESGFMICLTYGEATDWLRNMRAAGWAELMLGGTVWTIAEDRLIHDAARHQPLPWLVRQILTLMRVQEFLIVSARAEHKE